MKTVSCDICHKTQEQIWSEGYKAEINRYAKTTQHRWWEFEKPDVVEFDICDLCLQAIHEARKKGGKVDDL